MIHAALHIKPATSARGRPDARYPSARETSKSDSSDESSCDYSDDFPAQPGTTPEAGIM